MVLIPDPLTLRDCGQLPITNAEYQEINGISKRTAAYELVELVDKYQIFKQFGASVGIYYEIT